MKKHVIKIGSKPLSELTTENVMSIVLIEGCCSSLEYWNEPEILEFDDKTFGDTVVVDYISTRKKDLVVSSKYSFFFNKKFFRYHVSNKFCDDKGVPRSSERLGLESLRYLIKEGFDVPLYTVES